MRNVSVLNFKEIRQGLGVADRIHNLHNLSPFSAKSVSFIQIQTYQCWVSFESKLNV